MTWHSTGKVTNKTSMSAEQMKAIMENADIKDRRCIYENDDILVQHMRADYPNGTKDATMHVSLKKNGFTRKDICHIGTFPSQVTRHAVPQIAYA